MPKWRAKQRSPEESGSPRYPLADRATAGSKGPTVEAIDGMSLEHVEAGQSFAANAKCLQVLKKITGLSCNRANRKDIAVLHRSQYT